MGKIDDAIGIFRMHEMITGIERNVHPQGTVVDNQSGVRLRIVNTIVHEIRHSTLRRRFCFIKSSLST